VRLNDRELQGGSVREAKGNQLYYYYDEIVRYHFLLQGYRILYNISKKHHSKITFDTYSIIVTHSTYSEYTRLILHLI